MEFHEDSKAKPIPNVSQVEDNAGHIMVSEHDELERNFSFLAAAGLAFGVLGEVLISLLSGPQRC